MARDHNDIAIEYLRTLDLKPGVTPHQVRQAYRTLAKVWHPDRFSNDLQLQKTAQEKMKEINAAYAWISSNADILTLLMKDATGQDTREGSFTYQAEAKRQSYSHSASTVHREHSIVRDGELVFSTVDSTIGDGLPKMLLVDLTNGLLLRSTFTTFIPMGITFYPMGTVGDLSQNIQDRLAKVNEKRQKDGLGFVTVDGVCEHRQGSPVIYLVASEMNGIVIRRGLFRRDIVLTPVKQVYNTVAHLLGADRRLFRYLGL